jgi:two-component sensor histidine kinase
LRWLLSALALDWREQFGPKVKIRRVKIRRKKGFGSMVIERNLASALDAAVDFKFDPDGLRGHIVMPASQILAAR